MAGSRVLPFVLAGCLVVATAGQASAVTVTFKEGGGTGYINLKWDAVSINPPLNTNAADWETYHLQAADVSPGTEKFYVLMAIKNLLTELPITSADYDTSVMESWTWLPIWYGCDSQFNVTVMLKAMYDAAQHYGWCLTDHPSSPHEVEIFIMNPGTGTSDNDARLVVEYTDAGTYGLVVDSGTGDGTGIAPGTQVAIAADAPATGNVWVSWIGDIAWVYEPGQMNTILEMPSKNATVTASYAPSGYQLTVNGGTGSDEYEESTVVPIVAGAAPGCESFMEWVGDTDYVTDPTLASTDVTMPAAAVEVTATYGFYRGDVNNDGFVGGTDLDYVLGDWGKGACPP